MKRRSLTIGITIGLREADESLWLNGIKQNALYLAKLFLNSRYRHEVRLLNTTPVPITDTLPWDRTRFPTMPFEAGWTGLDVLIELGGQIHWEHTAALKQQGTKIVSYCCGPEYVQNIEAMIFQRKLYDSIYVNRDYDCIWAIPQVWDLNRGFFETLRRCPVREVPFVWDPMALQAATKALPNAGEYRPSSGGKRISVLEPNIDVLKFCLYPIFIAERAFREDPELIRFLYVANSDRFVHDNREFAALMHHLDLIHANKACFIGRVTTPTFLAEYTDVVVSHQWGLPLNYLYLECCWQGYPLVHNAEIVKDLGYYYHAHDLADGTRRLLDVLTSHDRSWQDYTRAQRAGIARFLADDPQLVVGYDDLLFELVGGAHP
ncbi:DUF2827 domain-containing protein [Methylobacterium sp. J-076]|uniref:DUF2827 domain-containing protein n=1 Tax=Methylobacterium sp. J-076 TaxID=2836655 RepID=UPI001FBA2ADB|nr:DUF2827 domain-containing protein [Methylobacterium sp. J-076]MCJ2013049.1 DUF2827 domain-containing protein [Methylobacterium sp. J-076]